MFMQFAFIFNYDDSNKVIENADVTHFARQRQAGFAFFETCSL